LVLRFRVTRSRPSSAGCNRAAYRSVEVEPGRRVRLAASCGIGGAPDAERGAQSGRHLSTLHFQKNCGSEIAGHEVIRPSAAANVEPGRGGAYQIPVAIERTEEAGRIGADIRLNAPQRALFDVERCLDGAVVTPKPDGAPGLVVGTAMVRKINHVIDAGFGVASRGL